MVLEARQPIEKNLPKAHVSIKPARKQPMTDLFDLTGRIGQPQDIGGTVVYMAPRAGDYLVGVNLTLDGGVVFARAG